MSGARRAASRAPWLALAGTLLLAGALRVPATYAAPPADAADAGALDQLLQLLAAHRGGHVTFTEVQQLAVLDRPLHSAGELLYQAPDRLEKRTLEPRREDLLLDHGVLTARRGGRSRTLALRDYPQAVPYVESLRATLAGDRAALERYFALQFSGSLAHWTLELTPVAAQIAGTVREVRIAGERDAIRTVEIRQTDGDASILTIGPELAP